MQRQKYQAGTINTQMNGAGRVEEHHGDLDEHFISDRLESLIGTLGYSTEDQRRNQRNPGKIPFNGNIVS